MTPNSKRDAADPDTIDLHPGAVERVRADRSIVKTLAVVALLAAAGLWFYSKDKEMVSSDGTVVQTTGAGVEQTRIPDEPNSPAPAASQSR